jgi:hypothetical protein
MSSRTTRGANKKVVIGVAVAAGLLVLIGLVRAVTSTDSKEADPASASAAPSTAPPATSAVETAPAQQVEPPPSGEAPAPAPPPAQVAPTSEPAPTPTVVLDPVPMKRLPPPAKKKPYRPSGI